MHILMVRSFTNIRWSVIAGGLLIAWIIAPSPAEAFSRPPEIVKRSGSLVDLVERASTGQLPRESNLFRVPTPGQVKAWNFIVESIFKGRLADADKMIRQLSFPFEISLFTDNTTRREYVVLEEAYPLKAGWGLFIFDTKTKNPLVLEIPHPVFDSKTEFQGIDAFLQTGARAYLLAGSHRRANTLESPCSQPKSSTSETIYPVSDVAHAVATPFHAVHESLVKLMPTTVAVQLHGMGERDVCRNAFISTGTSTVTTNSTRLLSCLTKSGVDAEIYDGNTTCPLTALSNVQGRFSNGETADPCGKGVPSSPQPGSFIHIEQEPVLRRDPKAWQPVIDGLKCAFPVPTNETTVIKPVQSFTFKSPDNPEIKVFYALRPKISSKTKVLVVMAGRQRDADAYIESWVDWGGRSNYVVIAPQFDVKNWPEPLGYNFGNLASGSERSNTPNPRSKWSFTVLEQLFDEVRKRFSVDVEKYDLFGHSAGGQFVHRFLLFYPENRVRVAVAANPGFYTFPDSSIDFPYGLKDSPVAVSQKQLLDWTNADLIIMRGTADIQRTESLRQTPEADAQGKHRYERAGVMYGTVRGLNPNTRWRLIDVPDIAHDQKGMAKGAQRVLPMIK
jgi:hypothetical protein